MTGEKKPMAKKTKKQEIIVGDKKILFVGAEAMPFAASGGLGDVLGSLPAALKAAGGEHIDVRVVMPLYGAVSDKYRKEMTFIKSFEVKLAWRRQYCGVFALQKEGVIYYFLDNEYYFKRDSLYGSFDDGERFAFFSLAAVEMLRQLDYYPDILHAHDWQAALSLVYLNRKYRFMEGYGNIRTVFTIHNIEYQGQYDFSILGDVFSLSPADRALMEYDGCINLMKAAIECADRVTTVSPRYAEEILGEEYSHKLYHVLRRHAGKLSGILNGIDYVYYDPATDPVIAANFDPVRLKGKTADKAAIQEQYGLPVRADVPLVMVISRLVAHKGVDLIAGMADQLLNDDVQMIVLGKGDAAYEDYFRELERKYPDRMRALITYDRDLSKKLYAAADIFLMPSRSEPCGLSQMIASRYGAIPVTRETGGLYDSIKGYWEKDGEIMGNGFTFANYRADELLDRTRAAADLWRDAPKRRKLVKKIMRTDFSWHASAKKYLELYAGM